MRVLLICIAMLLAAPALALEVGFGRRSLVTEQPGVSLGGYGGRGLLPALGVHDETLVKAMVIRASGRTIAIVTTDLIGVQRTILEALRKRPLPGGLAADDILICASHTHAGYGSLAKPTGAPSLDLLFWVTCGAFKPAFFEEVVGKVHGAIVDAHADLRPARIGVGSREAPGLSRNRGKGGGPTDPELGVVRVTSPEGTVRGLLVNFAAHPVILGADNMELSAEWPGALQRDLERRYPGATVMFSQGAGGDQSPRVPGEHKDDWAKVEAMGRALGDRVAEFEGSIATAADVPVDARLIEIEFPEPKAEADRKHFQGGQRRSLLQQVVLGDALLMGIPGEPCCRIGLDLKAAARKRGFRSAFVLGLSQDHCGYFVHADDYADPKSHEYEKRLNYPGPGVGATLIEAHFGALDPRPLSAATAW